MCFSEVKKALAENGVVVSTCQIRWAINAGHVSRPAMDASLRFRFSDENIAELLTYFRAKLAARGMEPAHAS